MQGVIDFGQAPPLTAPLRFFLVAPWFMALAGGLILVVGPDFFLSRWHPAVLAATHLLTLGFMLQIMLGALIQVLPVVAGAPLHRPLGLARLLQPAITVGTLLLAAGFLGHQAWAFHAGGALLVAGGALFLGAAGAALKDGVSRNPTIRGLKMALAGLGVTLALGLLLVVWLVIGERSLLTWTDVHATWGLGVWVTGLLMAVAYVVVPMFQLTPAYRTSLANAWPWVLWAGAGLASFAGMWDETRWLAVGATGVALAAGTFAVVTWQLLQQRRRARRDATTLAWQAGTLMGGAGAILVIVLQWLPLVGAAWTLLAGILVMVGGLGLMMLGMLCKIVPFLAWMHFQQQRPGVFLREGMGRFLPDGPSQRLVWALIVATGLLMVACFWPTLARGAGAFLMACGVLLGYWMYRAYRNYAVCLAEFSPKAASTAGRAP